MSKFFIYRPIFAWVIAILISIAGLIAIPNLGVERFPTVAPPKVALYLTYEGATPKTMNDNVISLIEREISGVKDLLYYESASDSNGSASITVTFKRGTDPQLAQVEIQNKMKAIEPRLPQAVRNNGVIVESSASNTLMYINLISPNGRYDEAALNDYMIRNMVENLKRVDGVGRVEVYGSEYAMRIWVDTNKLTGYNLTMSDVTTAIADQNVQIATGKVGDSPTVAGKMTVASLFAKGQLETPEEFESIVLRSGINGSQLLLKDVARVELGRESYKYANRNDGQESTSLAIKLFPNANAVLTSDAIRAYMESAKQVMPAGMDYKITSDSAPFAKISIKKVVVTLAEAMLLVFLVMYLFLQRVIYTLIPAIVAPIALLGTLAVMYAIGFSVNVFTMFGMVLVIGIIVDDAIIVVENVERIMAKEGLPPREATIKAMKEITGAVIGVTGVLSAVYLPIAFAAGSVGTIYQQFSITMATAILFSAFLALCLTPALCATLLKPIGPDHHAKTGFFGWFNRSFEFVGDRYQTWTTKLSGRVGRIALTYVLLIAACFWGFNKIPSTFLPNEDQGYFFTSIQLPSNATQERTKQVITLAENYLQEQEEVRDVMTILGFSFSGSGSASAFMVTTLKDWQHREGVDIRDTLEKFNIYMMDNVKEGEAFSMLPPAIDGLGNSSNISLQLLDKSNADRETFQKVKAEFLRNANANKKIDSAYFEAIPDTTGIELLIDREKARAQGVSFTDISQTLTTALGSTYVNDFPNKGRMQKVIVQSQAENRMDMKDILKMSVKNNKGGTAYLSEFVSTVWKDTPLQLKRFNGSPAVAVSVMPKQGYSSGEVMKELESIVKGLSSPTQIEWTGLSRQERQAEAQTNVLLVFSMLVIFLVLAALYESWSIPLAVIVATPLGILGAVAAMLATGLPNDVFFKVGLVSIIGLTAKNAILMIEFAQQQVVKGLNVIEAISLAAKLRLRPIIMTSLAFTCGIIPLVLASGPSSEIQNSLGTGVLGGMISGTVLILIYVPIAFILVSKLTSMKRFKAKDN
ncbi:multidrug efflux RND transporter permease subunit [Vibrio nomapromontoriensis]|uniref:multidrug efflux RND transporter permease subunit n=1 Tax=Vibrio nomapromontoriensis TaxID=2910246 RepID=UPI003D0D7A1D